MIPGFLKSEISLQAGLLSRHHTILFFYKYLTLLCPLFHGLNRYICGGCDNVVQHHFLINLKPFLSYLP